MGRFFIANIFERKKVMDEKIIDLKKELDGELCACENVSDLENIRVKYLGKKGSVTDLLKEMKNLSNEEKKTF